MVIKNKNGSEYKVRQPNPIMKNQEVWNDFVLHNMDFDGNVVENAEQKTKSNKKKLVLGSEKTIKTNDIPVVLPPVKKIEQDDGFIIPDFSKPENEPEPTPQPKDEILRPKSINQKLLNYKKDVMYCMLAETKENFDPLYSEKSVKISYIKSLIFENIIISQSDIELIFWSHLDFLTKNSVVYPKDEHHRWWKIDVIRSAPDGKFFQCVPTTIQPSFKR